MDKPISDGPVLVVEQRAFDDASGLRWSGLAKSEAGKLTVHRDVEAITFNFQNIRTDFGSVNFKATGAILGFGAGDDGHRSTPGGRDPNRHVGSDPIPDQQRQAGAAYGVGDDGRH